MLRQLIDYLPPVIKNVQEYQAIMNNGEQAEISALWDAVDYALDDQFVQSATENGVERWEKILGIKPKGTDILEDRKFRILSRISEQLPYTLPVLKNMLQSLCGADGYSVEVQNELYILKVKIALVAKSNFDDVNALLKRVVPANIVIELVLMYNTWSMIKNFTWDYLKAKTWRDIKNEVLE
ncbi:MAG: putative phage tail protein [Oscillospiraceae bacterium]|nr:putative phage tail protein [Oscillospiraceae bacterium]